MRWNASVDGVANSLPCSPVWDNQFVLLEDHASAFIVRVWLEHREVEDAQVEWRGYIEHVASGNVKYLTALDEITEFIRAFFEEMGVNLDAYGQKGGF